MNRYFGFSPAQKQTLIVLAAMAVLAGAVKLTVDSFQKPPLPVGDWKVVTLDAYRPPLVVNLNTAPVDSLELIPGIGPAFARKIVDYRQRHGPFRAIDSLVNIPGVGDAKLGQWRPYLTIDGR